MFEIQDRLGRPVKVIRDEGYLLIQRREGVAYDPPSKAISTSNRCAHSGQIAA